MLGALIGGVAGWQLLSQLNADSHGESSSAIGTQAFAAHGVSLTYPGVLRHLEGDELDRLEFPIFKAPDFGDPSWKEVFALDENSLVAVYPVPDSYVVTSENVAEYGRWVVGGWKRLGFDAPVASDSVLQGLPMLNLAGGEARTLSGNPIRNDVTMVFSGSMNYTVECQSTASTSLQILAACTHIIESLRVPSSSSAGWHVLASGDDAIHVSVPRLWSEDSSHPASVNLAVKLQSPSSPGYIMSLWITLLHEPYFTESAKGTAALLSPWLRMPLTHERSVRLPIGMAEMAILKDDSRNVIGYVVIKDNTAAVVTFTFAPEHMRLVRPTIDAVARTLTLD